MVKTGYHLFGKYVILFLIIIFKYAVITLCWLV